MQILEAPLASQKLISEEDINPLPQRLLTPISESRSPSPDLELSELKTAKPMSRPASPAAYQSPSSIYSRATDDSKAFTSTPESAISKQAHTGAYFIYRDGEEICDTRQLFENTAAPPHLLIAALAVLTGDASLEGIKALDQYRSNLPKFWKYVHRPHLEETELDRETLEWRGSQQVFEKRENALLANAPDERYTEVLAGEYGSVDGLSSPRHCSEGSYELSRFQLNARQVNGVRGRSPTQKSATAAEED